ncbi:protein kinase [Candidatus Margulisiibacteriota bacterium]
MTKIKNSIKSKFKPKPKLLIFSQNYFKPSCRKTDDMVLELKKFINLNKKLLLNKKKLPKKWREKILKALAGKVLGSTLYPGSIFTSTFGNFQLIKAKFLKKLKGESFKGKKAVIKFVESITNMEVKENQKVLITTKSSSSKVTSRKEEYFQNKISLKEFIFTNGSKEQGVFDEQNILKDGTYTTQLGKNISIKEYTPNSCEKIKEVLLDDKNITKEMLTSISKIELKIFAENYFRIVFGNNPKPARKILMGLMSSKHTSYLFNNKRNELVFHGRYNKKNFELLGDGYILKINPNVIGPSISSKLCKASVIAGKPNFAGKTLVVKIIDSKSLMDGKEPIKEEIKMMKTLSGQKGIITFYGAVQQGTKFFIVMEYAEGGDIFGRTFKIEKLPDIFKQMTTSVSSLHKLNIIHRDLKPENFLINKNNEIKLADFGLSKQLKPGPNSLKLVGTYGYIDPRLSQSQEYSLDQSKALDIWSLGVIFYHFLKPNKKIFTDPKLWITPIPESEFDDFNSFISVDHKIAKLISKDDDAYPLAKPYETFKFLMNISKRCLDSNLTSRPKVKDLVF